MKDTEIKYFTEELQVTPSRAEEMYSKLEKQPDILNEFEFWLKERKFPEEVDNMINVNGYTAKKILEMAPFLEPIGAYNFLITLREEPEKALNYIKEGFPRK